MRLATEMAPEGESMANAFRSFIHKRMDDNTCPGSDKLLTSNWSVQLRRDKKQTLLRLL